MKTALQWPTRWNAALRYYHHRRRGVNNPSKGNGQNYVATAQASDKQKIRGHLTKESLRFFQRLWKPLAVGVTAFTERFKASNITLLSIVHPFTPTMRYLCNSGASGSPWLAHWLTHIYFVR